MRLAHLLTLLAAAGLVAAEGYTDTPLIPGTTWHVHDSARPQPPRADAAKLKCNEAAAPAGAVVLVGGADSANEWEADAVANAKLKTPVTWEIKDGAMVARRTASAPSAPSATSPCTSNGAPPPVTTPTPRRRARAIPTAASSS